MSASRPQRGTVLTAVILCILNALGAASPAFARTNQWFGNGPYGGFVSTLVVDPKTPDTLYAAGPGGIYKSADAGANWARASNGIADPSVRTIAIDPVTPSTLYAGSTFGGKVIKSTDGAATWTTLPAAPTLVGALAINPLTPSTLYAAQNQSGLHKSSDGGTTWARIGVATLPSSGTFKALLVDPKTPSTIYAGENSRGVFKSTDGGATWAAANGGLTGPIVQVLAMAIDPQTPSTLYVSASTSGGAGVFKSIDGGTSWAKILNDATGGGYQTIAVDPQAPATIYVGSFSVGLMRSTNGGASFATAGIGLPMVGVNVVVVDPLNSASVYTGLQDGVYASRNAGAAWSAVNNGLALTSVTAIAVDPVTPTTIYAGTKYSGIFKSVNSGDSWASISTGIGPTLNAACNTPAITSLAIDPGTPTTLYASSTCTQERGVLKSVNGGASWTSASTGLPPYAGIAAVAIDPLAPSSIFAGTTTLGLYRSPDGGAHWTAVPSVPATAHITGVSIAAFPSSIGAAAMVAVSTSGNSLFTSVDSGATFQKPPTPVAAAGLPPIAKSAMKDTGIFCDGFDNAHLTTLVVNMIIGSSGVHSGIPVTCETLLADGSLGLMNFIQITGTFPRAPIAQPAGAARPVGSTKAVAMGSNQNIAWGAPDGIASNNADCYPALSVVADPLDASSFYVGATCGVLKGSDLGRQMTTMSTGLPVNLQVRSLAVKPDGTDLYAGTDGGGLYRYTVAAAATPVPVVEYYNAALDHYFITWVPAEIAKLDAGTAIKGWARTGQTFRTYTTVEAGTSPVCRFYIPPGLGDSHFFGRGTQECNSTAAKNPTFINEDPDFMNMFLPAAGVCPAGTTQVYRVFSNRPDANHRYMTDQAIRASMVAKGWLAEGDGADLVVMCAP